VVTNTSIAHSRLRNSRLVGSPMTMPEEVVDATIDHGRRIHNMEATREQVVAALRGTAPADGSPG
jgi:hypothetical protein